MRRVPLRDLTPEMCLAKPVLYQNILLLNRGVRNLNKYAKTLKNMGIFSLYIEDAISHGIEVPELISEKTMLKSRGVLQNVFETFQKTGNVETTALHDSSAVILDELITREEILVNLENLGTTDIGTLSHSINVTVYALLLGENLGFSKTKLLRLAESAMLHDIGKTVLDQAILFKTEKLTDTEFAYIKTHTTRGYDVLTQNTSMSAVTKNVALYHHERLDGSGYPDGIPGRTIHEFAQIVAIADIYDALTMNRCYRKAMPIKDALKILTHDAGSKLNKYFVETFIAQLAIYPNGSLVRLSDNRIGIVKCQNPSDPSRPVVRILYEKDRTKVVPYEMNLSETEAIEIMDDSVKL